MLTYLAIADKYKPKWIVWENVPGVLSSNGGKDFGVFLGALGELGYGFAYRILDAQYFGVAQRRRRVFVVGYLGDWRRAAAVLFERHSLQGHPAPSREKGQAIAPSVTTGPPFSRTGNDRVECEAMVVAASPDGNHTVGTLMARDYKGIGNQDLQDGRGLVLQPIAFSGCDDGMDTQINVTPTMRVAGNAQGNLAVAVGTDLYNGAITGDVAATMSTAGSTSSKTGPTVMQAVGAFKPGQSAKAHSIGYESEMAPTLEAGSGGNNKPAVHVGMAVRRLTPVECERLQGFSDNYTDIKSKNKPTPDGPRYKALGNSMAVPVMAWIGQRIEQVEAICKQNK
jgi:DNA (cytosine-5)-methyltransferase 1